MEEAKTNPMQQGSQATTEQQSSGTSAEKSTSLLWSTITQRREKAEKQLNRNFNQQLILILLGISIMLGATSVPEAFLKKYLTLGPEELNIAIPFLLSILFIRFGFLLVFFSKTREAYDALLEEATKHEEEAIQKLFEWSSASYSLFEILYNNELMKRSRLTDKLFVASTIVVITANHVVAYFFIERAAGFGWAIAISILYGFICAMMYHHFFSMRDQVQVRVGLFEGNPRWFCAGHRFSCGPVNIPLLAGLKSPYGPKP